MSMDLYEVTTKYIDMGYREKKRELIERETDYVISKTATLMTSMFSSRIKGISFDQYGLKLDEDSLLSDKHKNNLLKWLDRMIHIEYHCSDEDFGMLKVDFENWYYKMGGEEIKFEYHEDYLLTPKEAAEQLGVSKVTLNKYMKQGLEVADTTSHRKIPKHVIDLWKDPVYAIRMQMIFQEKKLRNQDPEERLLEIMSELTKLQIKYKSSTFQEAFKEYDGDSMDDPIDYYLWRDLELERSDIIKLLGGK